MRHITIDLDDDRFDDMSSDEAHNIIEYQIRHSEWDINQEWFSNLTVRVGSSEKERNKLSLPSTEELTAMMNKDMEGIKINDQLEVVRVSNIIAENPAGIAPCPFVYAKGKSCTGHIIRIEAFKADLCWQVDTAGVWSFSFGSPRSHYHLYCSEKGNHAGYKRQDSDAMKFYLDKLPESIRKMIIKTQTL